MKIENEIQNWNWKVVTCLGWEWKSVMR